MAAFLPIAVLLSLLVTGTMAGGYGSETTPSTSTPASSYTPTPATPPPPPPSSYTPQPATPPKPAHDYDDDNKLVAVVRVVVEGLLLCQSCARRGLDGAAPLPKAQVMVSCRDGKHQVMAVADSNGYFHAEFTVKRADDFWTKNPRGACVVRLLSSPDPKCKMVSDIHLRDEGKHMIDGRGFRNIVYAVRPLAFRPRKCPPPRHH